MSTITKLQLVCFFAGVIGGRSYAMGDYALTTICGMTAAVALGLIYSLIKP